MLLCYLKSIEISYESQKNLVYFQKIQNVHILLPPFKKVYSIFPSFGPQVSSVNFRKSTSIEIFSLFFRLKKLNKFKMHTVLTRGNAILAYTLSVLACLTFCCFLSTLFLGNYHYLSVFIRKDFSKGYLEWNSGDYCVFPILSSSDYRTNVKINTVKTLV